MYIYTSAACLFCITVATVSSHLASWQVQAEIFVSWTAFVCLFILFLLYVELRGHVRVLCWAVLYYGSMSCHAYLVVYVYLSMYLVQNEMLT